MIGVYVYYQGEKIKVAHVPVDSAKDAIIKTISNSSCPQVWSFGVPIVKVSNNVFRVEKDKKHNHFAIHTVRYKIDTLQAKKIKIDEYWII